MSARRTTAIVVIAGAIALGLGLFAGSSYEAPKDGSTLLAVSRNGSAHINPEPDFRLQDGDDAVVVAESLGTLAPLRLAQVD